jgi:hypothetical protein
MMDYAARLMGAGQPPGKPMGGSWKPPGVSGQGALAGAYQLSAAGAQVTPEQQSILDAIAGIFNSAGRAK